MNALSRLITRATIRQFQQATTPEQTAAILDRTIAFAQAETPYISEEQIDEIVPYIPVTEPVVEVPVEE